MAEVFEQHDLFLHGCSRGVVARRQHPVHPLPKRSLIADLDRPVLALIGIRLEEHHFVMVAADDFIGRNDGIVQQAFAVGRIRIQICERLVPGNPDK